MFLHSEIAPTIAESPAFSTFTSQCLPFILSIGIVADGRLGMLIATTVSECLPISIGKLPKKIKGPLSILEVVSIRILRGIQCRVKNDDAIRKENADQIQRLFKRKVVSDNTRNCLSQREQCR